MIGRRASLVAGIVCVAWSCSRTSASPSPAPGGGAASAAPASAPPASTPPATAPGGAGRPRRPPPSRDSVTRARAFYVAQVLQSIAGHENEPAERVFKNVQVLKGLTAGQLVHKMDEEYGVALSWSCTNCHRPTAPTAWASDTATDKRRARAMQLMLNDINGVYLPKLYPKDTPKATCMTCHRGYNEPPGEFPFPEAGKPGAPPPKPPAGR